LAHGGSAGRDAATGRGGVIVLSEVLQHLDDQSLSRGITYAVQGFGNVGAFFGLVAAKDYPAWHMVAASDSSAGVFDQAGLDPQVIDDWKKSRRALHDFTDATVITNEQLIAADVDVLVLAALGDSVTASNMHDVKAKIILELANAPVSDEAYEYLTKRGVLIVPDILANAGGVIVSYLEWMQNKHGEHWTEVAVNTKLGVYLRDATAKIYTVSERRGMSLKDAAFAVAIERLSNRGEIIA
jgi:glutamate dehydrogenase/leucine dehydrogenase